MDLGWGWVQKGRKQDNQVGQAVIWTRAGKAGIERRGWLKRYILKEELNNVDGQFFLEARMPFHFLSG